MPPSIAPTFMKMDILGALDIAMLSVVMSFLFVNLFDTAGTLLGVATRAKITDEFGNAKDKKDHFDYIFSYAPYNNIKKMDYPHMLITTSLSDNRVLFDEPAKFTAKLRDLKTDNNLLLLKTEMNAGHGGKSGRDGAIEEIAFDYAFILKISEKI